MDDLEERLLQHLGRPEYQPVKPRVIAKQLGLAEDQRGDLKRALKKLVKRGLVVYGASHIVLGLSGSQGAAPRDKAGKRRGQSGDAPLMRDLSPADHHEDQAEGGEETGEEDGGDAGGEASDAAAAPATRRQRSARKRAGVPRGESVLPPGAVKGRFRRMQSGHGYVRPEGTPREAERSEDIYVDARHSLDAATGDTVLVRPVKRGRPDRKQGEVVEVLDRQSRRFVGTFFEKAGQAFVQIDGRVFTQPVPLGDPGAKLVKDEDKIVVDMVHFPSAVHDGEAVIVEVLGARGQPGVDTLSIIKEFLLPEGFSAESMAEAERQAELFTEEPSPDRTDFTGKTVITIDPVDARDFDDAISLEKNDVGHWVLGVHIADVSHFVQQGSPLDREAYDRATSVYLPDRVIPMLPELISNGLASLQPDRVRYVMSMLIEMTPAGVVVDTRPASGFIKSARRFTYEEVDEFLADREAWRSRLTPAVFRLLSDMHELAMVLRARRFRRGALDLVMPEVKVDLNRDGEVTGAHLVKNTESHQIIEEFMLSANEAVAELLSREGFAFLRRVHGNPDPRRLKQLTEFVEGLGFPVESLESRFELQRVLKLVEGRPEQYAVNFALLRSLAKAVYSPDEEGHFALASDCYCHFTSPIRRYPDLTIHRSLKLLLAGKRPVNNVDLLVIQGDHCSDRERRAENAEHELVRIKLLNFLSTKIGERLKGVITGVEEFGFFVQGTALPVEGLVHVTSLADDFYRYDRRAHTLSGSRAGNQFRLGDHVEVEVARVDVDRRELDLRLVGRGARAERPDFPGSGGKPGKYGGKSGGKGKPPKDARGKGKQKPDKRGRKK